MKPRPIYVKVAHHAVGQAGDLLVTLGLGSCVAIMLHDRQARVGGLAHVLLPEPALARDRGNSAKFAATAVPMLIEEMAALGARSARLEARIVGGASMFATLMVPGSLNMGERNIRASREALRKAGIPLLGEAVGGDHGRSVRFNVAEGSTLVSSVGKQDVVL
ncbi:MAG TPA: chemotaxis protein CheD [Longimicrobium sp.]|nr:chemotaxis protein CheD [Longimicrobium sp.]